MDKKKLSLELRVGLFVAVTVLAIFVLILSQAKTGKMRGYEVIAIFEYVGGLESGAPVRVSGVRIGEVRSIEIVYDVAPVVFVRMRLRPDVKIAQDSRITIQTLGLIGEKHVEISPGIQKKYLHAGDTIMGESPLSMERLASVSEGIITRLDGVIQDISEITSDKDVKDNFKDILENTSIALQRVESSFAVIEELAAEFSQTNKGVRDVLHTSIPKIDQLVEDTNLLVVSGKTEIERTFAEFNDFAVSARNFTEHLNEISLKASADISKTAEAISGTSGDFSDASEVISATFKDFSETAQQLKLTGLYLQLFFQRIQSEGFIARLLEEDELVDDFKKELKLLQEATTAFTQTITTAEAILKDVHSIVAYVEEGEGNVGKFLRSDELYREVHEFVEEIKANPWKLFIRRRN